MLKSVVALFMLRIVHNFDGIKLGPKVSADVPR